MITTTDKQKKTLKGLEKQLAELQVKANQINGLRSTYITAILEGADVDSDKQYQLDKSYNLVEKEETE